jgi:quinol-cytochrome oxidoreductase complex cytochrome b subunit/coenzyme F420-reducing hydrogenase delta subunit/Pyruvate/2-oxoacid:ferredoxin oxidoreductase delta subunit
VKERKYHGSHALLRFIARLERPFSKWFESENNPAHHLGALTIYLFWIVLVSGIYLFIFYDTSLSGAWLSLERITHEQWYAGGVMRSLHRYASDAAVITMILHLSREFLRGRYRGVRWYSWFTGVPLLWLVFIFGITGYWMVWDQLAQYVAISTARLLDWLPIFSDPMQRNFLTNETVNERFFTLMAFIHLVGLPIVLVLGIWFHLLRVRMPRINPPRMLMAGSLAALLALSLAVPAVSHPPADLGIVPTELRIDWYYLAIYPLLDLSSEGIMWAGLWGLSLFLCALPWLPPMKHPPAAVVHLPDCTGCEFCAEDCPYGAIEMVPRTDERNFKLQAQVDPALCVSCGICTGSCPSSSPFRKQEPLRSGIELPYLDMEELKRRMQEAASGLSGSEPRVVLVGCDYSVRVAGLAQPGVATLSLPCAGMLPPSAIDYLLRAGGADGVVVTGCDAGDCHFRHGDRWVEARVARERMPKLRSRVPRERLLLSWHKPIDRRGLHRAVEGFRGRLANLPQKSPEQAK